MLLSHARVLLDPACRSFCRRLSSDRFRRIWQHPKTSDFPTCPLAHALPDCETSFTLQAIRVKNHHKTSRNCLEVTAVQPSCPACGWLCWCLGSSCGLGTFSGCRRRGSLARTFRPFPQRRKEHTPVSIKTGTARMGASFRKSQAGCCRPSLEERLHSMVNLCACQDRLGLRTASLLAALWPLRTLGNM